MKVVSWNICSPKPFYRECFWVAPQKSYSKKTFVGDFFVEKLYDMCLKHYNKNSLTCVFLRILQLFFYISTFQNTFGSCFNFHQQLLHLLYFLLLLFTLLNSWCAHPSFNLILYRDINITSGGIEKRFKITLPLWLELLQKQLSFQRFLFDLRCR